MSKSPLKRVGDIVVTTSDDGVTWVEFILLLSFENISSFDLVCLIGEMDRRIQELTAWVAERGYKVDGKLSKQWHIEGNVLMWQLAVDSHLESLKRRELLEEKAEELSSEITGGSRD